MLPDDATAVLHDFIILEKSEVNFAVQMNEWKNILLRGHEKEEYEQHLQRFNAAVKMTIQYFDEAKSILDELGHDTQVIGLLIESHAVLQLHHQEALEVFESNKRLNNTLRTNPNSEITLDNLCRGINHPAQTGV
jgi:hypothetical protein